MHYKKLKHFMLWLGLLLPIAWCDAYSIHTKDGTSNISIKEATVQHDLH